jgi:prepilin-type N-terminal cleavage/methylation domain-containing protein
MTKLRRGFTLLEAAVALLIVATVATGTLASVAAQTRAAAQAQARLEAMALAEDVLARIRLMDQRALPALPDSLRRGQFPSPFDESVWEAEMRPSSLAPGLQELVIRVSGADRDTELRTRRLLTSSEDELR